MEDYKKEIVKDLKSISYQTGERIGTIFRDWTRSCAIATSNSCATDDGGRWHDKEEEYLGVVEKYGAEHMTTFSRMLGLLTIQLELKMEDVLGQTYMMMEAGNDWLGQIFTPDSVSEILSSTTIPEVLEKTPITMSDPACGAGAMLIAAVSRVMNNGYNPNKDIIVYGTDVDRSVLLMAYLQLSLLGIQGYLTVGNSITMEIREVWVTPMAVWDGRPALALLRASIDS